MFEIILVAVDASDQKHAVLRQAAEITRHFNADLHLVSVYDLNQLWEARVPEPVPEIFESLEAESKKLLQDAQQQLSEWGILSKCHFLQGSVIEQIASLAERINADLVVTGHRYVSGLRRLLESSAAKGLIDKSPCSVMIIREGRVVLDR